MTTSQNDLGMTGAEAQEYRSRPTLWSIQRAIDYDASIYMDFFNECEMEGQHGSEAQKNYQMAYNALVILRQKLTPEHLAQVSNWKGPEALERIFLNGTKAA